MALFRATQAKTIIKKYHESDKINNLLIRGSADFVNDKVVVANIWARRAYGRAPRCASYDIGLYVSEQLGHTIRTVGLRTREVSTLAGSGEEGSADGRGREASFNGPSGLALQGDTLYVADGLCFSVARVSAWARAFFKGKLKY